MNRIDAVPLTQAMERANTVNPHGDEDLCTTQLADLLKSPGFACRKVEFAPQRSSLVVRCGGSSGPSRQTTVSRVDGLLGKMTGTVYGGQVRDAVCSFSHALRVHCVPLRRCESVVIFISIAVFPIF